MEDSVLDMAMAELEELKPIEVYELARKYMMAKRSEDIELFAFDFEDYRTDTLEILIQAEKLSVDQLNRIKKVDQYLLANAVPESLQALKDWLKTHSL